MNLFVDKTDGLYYNNEVVSERRSSYGRIDGGVSGEVIRERSIGGFGSPLFTAF